MLIRTGEDGSPVGQAASADPQQRDTEDSAARKAGEAVDRKTVLRHFLLALGLIIAAVGAAAILAR